MVKAISFFSKVFGIFRLFLYLCTQEIKIIQKAHESYYF